MESVRIRHCSSCILHTRRGRTSLNVNGSGWRENASFTLNATDVHGVVYEISDDREPSKRFQGEDQRGRDMPDVEPTHGNRGGNVPLVMEIEDEIEDSFDGPGGGGSWHGTRKKSLGH